MFAPRTCPVLALHLTSRSFVESPQSGVHGPQSDTSKVYVTVQ